MSDDWREIGPGGTDEEFLGEMIDRHREMMFRTARAVTGNDYDADDVARNLNEWARALTRRSASAIARSLNEMWRDMDSGRMSLDFYWRGWSNKSCRERR